MRVTLYRDHPAEGWPSMDRYAESLKQELDRIVPEGWSIRMPLPPDPWPGPYGQLLSRSLLYPVWARSRQGNLNHVVDHSYGHLLFVLDPARTIVTVHDVAPLHFPGRRVGLSGLAWKLAWQGIRRAQHIIVDSNFIATELQTYLNLAPERLHVVPLAVSARFCPQSSETRASIRTSYLPRGGQLLLHVGHTQPRKNLSTLLQAVALLRQQDVQSTLVQIGGQLNARHRELIQELGLEKAVHFVGRVADDDLPAFYSAANVFVLPSLYEGFGMPALEAMACGTPVMAGNAASLPEVVGDAGLLVDPKSPEALAEAIDRVLRDPELARELRRRGLERAQRFTWKRTAQETLAAYQSVLEDRA